MTRIENAPIFPIRVIFDDGECAVIKTQEELFESFASLDSTDPRNGVWIRDDFDRTIRLRLSGGELDILELAPSPASSPSVSGS